MTDAIDWEAEHLGTSIQWVSDHDLDFVYAAMRLTDILERPPCRILEVGVGREGTSIRHIAKRHEVVAVDIAQTAIAKVADVAETRLIGNLAGLAPVDLAFAHVVAQHCDDERLRELLCNVLGVLKPEARFLVQYAEDLSPTVHCTVPEPFVFVRTPDAMHNFAVECGGLVVEEWDAGEYPDWGVRWHVMAITARNAVAGTAA